MDAKVKLYLTKIGSKGGKARAAKHDKAKLTEWAKLGGRPRKKEKEYEKGSRRFRENLGIRHLVDLLLGYAG